MPRKTNRNGWTAEENEWLKAMVAEGATAFRAAAAFGRTSLSVRNQARKLGTPFPPMREVRKKWANAPSNSWRSR
jgi:hypothetical protein